MQPFLLSVTDKKRVEALAAEIRKLRNDVRGLRLNSKNVSVNFTKVNTTDQENV